MQFEALGASNLEKELRELRSAQSAWVGWGVTWDVLLGGTGMVGEAKGCEDVGKDIFGDVAHVSCLSL